MKRLIVLLVTVAALLAPSAALASGVVLKVQQATHLVAVVRTPSSVALVHTSAKLAVGQRIALQARTLRNGTLAASSIKVLGRAHRVSFRGLVLSKSALEARRLRGRRRDRASPRQSDDRLRERLWPDSGEHGSGDAPPSARPASSTRTT